MPWLSLYLGFVWGGFSRAWAAYFPVDGLGFKFRIRIPAPPTALAQPAFVAYSSPVASPCLQESCQLPRAKELPDPTPPPFPFLTDPW